jgi:hypothetical protein
MSSESAISGVRKFALPVFGECVCSISLIILVRVFWCGGTSSFSVSGLWWSGYKQYHRQASCFYSIFAAEYNSIELEEKLKMTKT